jgi:hypothetical protein
MMFVLFMACGVAYGPLTASATGFKAFQALYFLSSFFNQFGPNWWAHAALPLTENHQLWAGVQWQSDTYTLAALNACSRSCFGAALKCTARGVLCPPVAA